MKTVAIGEAALPYLERDGLLSCFSFDVLPYVRIIAYEKNEYIIRGNEKLTHLLYLWSGAAKLYGFHRNGRRSLIHYFTPPCVLGGTELFNQDKNPFPLVALDCCIFVEVDMLRCEKQLMGDARFLRFLCSMVLQQNIAQHRRYMNLVAYPSRNNLAGCLLMLQREGAFGGQYTELADYLGISYRHLMRMISEMCEEGILLRDPEGLRIVDEKELRRLADEIADEEME